jgi:hypothetical protein
VKTPQHNTRDRLLIAEVSGALSYLSGRVTSGDLTEDQAVTALHAITTDRHLLAHGLGGCLGAPGKWAADSPPVRLALAAGVDLVEAAAIYDETHPPGARGMRLGREG